MVIVMPESVLRRIEGRHSLIIFWSLWSRVYLTSGVAASVFSL